MTNQKVGVAFCGSAILTGSASANAQQAALAKTAEYLIQFIQNGDELIISHGNGPQSNLLLQ